jgi:hypothetical protein
VPLRIAVPSSFATHAARHVGSFTDPDRAVQRRQQLV